MGFRLSKLYTRKGDTGTTSVDARNRLSKDHPKIEALGDLDELNCGLGVLLSSALVTPALRTILTGVQQELFNLGGELCVPAHPAITPEKVAQLEQWIDEWNASLPALKEFLLPGGNSASAACHLARAICRRAERRLVSLQHEEPFNVEILKYINRLSDLLFVFARVLGQETQEKEVLWDHARGQ